MMLRQILVYFIIHNAYLLKLVRCEDNALYRTIRFQNYSTVKCINNILTKHCPCGTLTTFVNPNVNVDQLIQAAHEDNICHSIIVRSFEDRNWYTWTNLYVITAENLVELSSGMLYLTRDVFWNPRARFIFQVNNLYDDQTVQDFFKIILKYNIFKIILLQSLENDAMIYTYHPFRDHNCGKKIGKIVNIGNCENSSNITKYFPNNVPSQLQNCTIRVVASDDVPNFISVSSNYTVYGRFIPGLEQYVLDTVATRLGFFIEYHVFNEDEIFYGIVLPNKSSTGLLNYIDSDKADLAAGGYILMKNRVELFDYLYGFNYASYNLYTPAVGSNIWKRLYREFGKSTWCLIGSAFILMVLICQRLKILLKDNTYSILNTWGYFFGNANKGLSKNHNFRMIILWWSWFTFFIVNFYNTALFSLISVHVHEKPHSISPSNLKSLPYKPCISDNTRMFFQFAYNQELPEDEGIHKCSYTDGALQYVASTKQYYAIEMEYSYTLKEYEYMNREGRNELESWTFSGNNVIVIYLVRGFPYKRLFQKYATSMFETGLIKNHLNTIHLRSYTVLKRHPKTFKNTSLLDLRIHFCILLLGYILSFMSFLLEIWYDYIKVNSNR